jgi:ComF family protein
MPREFGRFLRLATARLLDLVYPPQCALCGASLSLGRGLCDACKQALPRIEAPFCQRCGEAFEGRIDGRFDCPNCGKLKFAFEFARPAMKWDEGTRQLILRLKYSRAIHLAGELGRLLAEGFDDPRFDEARRDRWPLVPVPLHRARQQHRYFNQSAEIARAAAVPLQLPVVAMLKRVRSTSTQTRLTRKERLENLKGAFVLSAAGRRWLPHATAGVILVDDVLTTGSTIEACAATLRAAGIKRVQALTVMRG